MHVLIGQRGDNGAVREDTAMAMAMAMGAGSRPSTPAFVELLPIDGRLRERFEREGRYCQRQEDTSKRGPRRA